MTDKLPDLSRTAAALDRLDIAWKEFDHLISGGLYSAKNAKDLDQKIEELDQAVGTAYGVDTADRNDPETCASLRAGAPPPGVEESFVRRMVRLWKEQHDERLRGPA